MRKGFLWLFSLLLLLSYDEKSELEVLNNSTDEVIVSLSKKKLVLHKAQFSLSLLQSCHSSHYSHRSHYSSR